MFMRMNVILHLMFSFILMCCSEKETDRPDEPKIIPGWTGPEPSAKHGAKSADLIFQTDASTVVSFVVTSDPRKYSLQEVRDIAAKGGRTEKEISGTVMASANTETSASIDDLRENTKYTAYLVAQDPTDSTLHSSIKAISFKTFSRQDTLQFTSIAEDRKVDYLLYRPEEVFTDPDQKYPIAFFLTGFGEVGTPDRPIAMINNGSLTEYLYNGNDVPMIVMSIQHTREKWDHGLINESIDHALLKYPIDENKMYLIGMSGGAFGCWSFAQEYPERLAAIVPISGLGDTDKACKLSDLSIWSFHNGTDSIVNPGKARQMMKAIEACQPDTEVRFKVFPDAGHNAWRRVFNPHHEDWKKTPNEEKVNLYDWLISKSKS
jgi:predicted peptidase